jgi:hypothetical protein
MFARQLSENSVSSTDVLGGLRYTLYSEDGTFMVKCVNICHWLDFTYGDDFMSHPDYETTGKALMEWCEANNSHYYAAEREDFFIHTAISEAVKAGKDTVVVEDMS